MTAKQRNLRRMQLDRQIIEEVSQVPLARPKGGWLRAIREALGMTLDSFGERLEMSRQSAQQLESAEASERITVARLRAAAEALECELVLYLRPKRPLEKIVSDRAMTVARGIVTRTGHSMALEDQSISDSQLLRLVEETAEELIERGEQSIWQ
jgi:predicted DNA-binding mobile mystery protein A